MFLYVLTVTITRQVSARSPRKPPIKGIPVEAGHLFRLAAFFLGGRGGGADAQKWRAPQGLRTWMISFDLVSLPTILHNPNYEPHYHGC